MLDQGIPVPTDLESPVGVPEPGHSILQELFSLLPVTPRRVELSQRESRLGKVKLIAGPLGRFLSRVGHRSRSVQIPEFEVGLGQHALGFARVLAQPGRGGELQAAREPLNRAPVLGARVIVEAVVPQMIAPPLGDRADVGVDRRDAVGVVYPAPVIEGSAEQGKRFRIVVVPF